MFFELVYTECEGLINNQMVEIKFYNNDYIISKWICPRYTDDGEITISEIDNKVLNYNELEIFIKNIQENVNTKYYLDDEVIFEYTDNIFKVDVNTMGTGYNFDINIVDVTFDLNDNVIKVRLLYALSEVYEWLKKLR
jgi:hypothetical protein